MLRIQNLHLGFGERPIFDDISMVVTAGEKLALTGRNGAGKSTLFKVLTGEMRPDTGVIEKPKSMTLAFLKQELPQDYGRTVMEEIKNSLVVITQLQNELIDIEHKLSDHLLDHDIMSDLIDRMTTIQHQLEYLNADKIEGEIERILQGLGFSQVDFGRLTHEFSGGWRMRIELAKLLLAKPDLLLLDEPNNHLDIISIRWLESYLRAYEGAVVLISHDLMFVDNIADRIIEIDRGKIYDFKGKYSAFIEYKKVRKDIEQSEYNAQQKLIQHKEQLIDKFRAKASKASFAKSLQSELARMDVKDAPDEEQGAMKLRFQAFKPGGRIVFEATGLSKSYDDLLVLDGVDLLVERGQKLSFIGQNGQGKSTMVKMISGQLAPSNGQIQPVHEIKIGYYAQEHTDILDPMLTILQTLEDASLPSARPMVRNILGGLGFQGKDVDKKVRVLSGGEKSRLRLASLLVQEHNLLILDEPTHHLDIPSKEALKEAIKNYNGTIIIVSHDREFLRGLAEKTVYFANQKIRVYEGDIDYFLQKMESEDILQSFQAAETPSIAQTTTVKVIDPEIQKNLQRKIKLIEKQIDQLELKIKDSELKMANPDFYKSKEYDSHMSQYQKDKNQLKSLTGEWEQLIEEMG
ncbi:MAG: ABC-F family ATP-binding cassette domain-containing protein [Saprospiraceae bacterium]|nr:ABC-F family ATP-binding cassette domain-containing protein [Saprospiraceae bacterium]